MTNLVSQKTNNYQFAPGISLYGVDGKDGKSGLSGTSIFISQFDIDDTSDLQTFASYIRQGRSTALGSAEYIGRSYMTGDSFLFPNGYIYKIRDISTLIQAGDTISTDNFDKFFEFVGRITVNNEENGFVDSNDRLVLDTTNYKGFIINVSELPDTDLSEIESPMTVISDKISNDENIKFIDLKSIQSGQADVQFRIQYDTNNKCFMIESDNPILVNADLEVAYSDTNSSMTYDEYSKVYTQVNKSESVLTTFRSICDNLNWKIVPQKDDKLYNVVYEFTPTDMTNQIYYAEKQQDYGIVGDTTDVQNISGYNMWKYSMKYDGTKKYKKVKLHACQMTVSEIASPWEFKIQFRSGSAAEEPWKTFTLQQKTIKTYDGIDCVMYATDYFYVPSDVTELWLSAPDFFYNIVYGDFNEQIPVDEAKEQEKITALVDGEIVRFPIDVLKFATARYDTEFMIMNNNDKQSLYKLPDTAMFRFVGKLNKESEDGYDAIIVDREYYYSIPSTHSNKNIVEPGGTAKIVLSSYNDPSQIKEEDWTVSVIGQTEFVIKNEKEKKS